MRAVVRLARYVFGLLLALALLPLLLPHWLLCRLRAERCPHCGSGWRTALVGEWGDEHWRCRACAFGWFVPYRSRTKGGG